MDKITLDNNLNVYTEKSDKFKTWSAAVYIYRPLNKKEASYNALLAKVLKTSSKKYPTRKLLAKQTDKLYGAGIYAGVRKYADTHAIVFKIKAVCDRYLPEKITKQVAMLLKEMVTEPNVETNAFSESTVRLEKENLIKQIEAYVNDKSLYADKRCIEIMCEGDSYATDVNGDVEIIKSITPQSLYEHYIDVMTNSQIDVFICGNPEQDEIMPVFETLKTEKTEFDVKPVEITKPYREISEEMDVTQGKLVMGFTTDLTDNSDRCRLMVFNALFGGSATSKLFNNVREKLSLAYYANSRISVSKGIMLARSGIEIEKYEQTKNEILLQLEDICNGNITDDELENAKAHLINIYSSLDDDPDSAVSLKSGWITEGETRSPEEIIEDIKKVDKTEVIKTAKTYKPCVVYFLKGEQK